MKSKFVFLLMSVCLQAVFLTTVAHAGLLYNYHELALKDLDQMNKLISDKLKESKKSGSGQSVPLKECLQSVYARPDDDGLIEKVIPPLKNQLQELGVYEKTVESLVQEATNALKIPKNFKPAVQVTYAYFLENWMAQNKFAAKETGLEKKLFERIAAADISLSREAINERQLRMMKESKSPSKIAQDILEKMKAAPAQSAQSPGGNSVTEDTLQPFATETPHATPVASPVQSPNPEISNSVPSQK